MEEDILINNSVIWEYLANNEEYQNMKKISEETGIDTHKLRISLSKLNNYKLINRYKENDEFIYSIEKVLDAFTWAKAVELGIDISQLEKYIKLKCEEEEDSLAITLNGKFEEEENKKKEELQNKREKYFYGKAATEAAKSDLSKLVRSKEEYLEEYRKSKEYDKEVESLLILALESVQVAYNSLIKSFLKNK